MTPVVSRDGWAEGVHGNERAWQTVRTSRPALSLASQTGLRIDSIHSSTEAELKWVSPHVEEKAEM